MELKLQHCSRALFVQTNLDRQEPSSLSTESVTGVMAAITAAHEAVGVEVHGSKPEELETPVQVLKHTEVLNGVAVDVWVACKHAVALLPDLAPAHFSKAEFESGSGAPGSIGVFHFASGGSVKHRIDRVDDEAQTLAYTVIEGEHGVCSAELQFTAATDSDTLTEATWTLKYDKSAAGEAIPERVEAMKEMVVVTLQTFAKAAKRVVRHTRTLEAPVDTIWNILMHEDVILPKVIPHIIASYEFLEGNGEPGSVRLLKLGHAIPGGKHVVERIDINDQATKTWGYTVLRGDPKYKYLAAVMQFSAGPQENTTIAKWVGVYVPQTDSMPPPDLALHVWKVFENVAKASPQAVY